MAAPAVLPTPADIHGVCILDTSGGVVSASIYVYSMTKHSL